MAKKELKADPPRMHPMPSAPSAQDKASEGYVPPPPDPAEDLKYVAALAAGTAAQVSDISESITDGSNLKPSDFNAHAFVKGHLQQVNSQGMQPIQPMQSMQPVQPVQSVQPVQPVMQQQALVQPPPPSVAPYDDGQILRRLLSLEDKLDRLSQMGDKILKSLLKKNTKQVTIRFDDAQNTKQK
jgi:hypothetical protein